MTIQAAGLGRRRPSAFQRTCSEADQLLPVSSGLASRTIGMTGSGGFLPVRFRSNIRRKRTFESARYPRRASACPIPNNSISDMRCRSKWPPLSSAVCAAMQ